MVMNRATPRVAGSVLQVVSQTMGGLMGADRCGR